jgi:hypothetical protein
MSTLKTLTTLKGHIRLLSYHCRKYYQFDGYSVNINFKSYLLNGAQQLFISKAHANKIKLANMHVKLGIYPQASVINIVSQHTPVSSYNAKLRVPNSDIFAHLHG